MNDASLSSSSSRREFIKNTGRLAAVSALAGVALPSVHAAGSDLIQIALIGCGGRGTGAASDALSTKSGPIKLVAMADVFEDRLAKSFGLPKERRRGNLRNPAGISMGPFHLRNSKELKCVHGKARYGRWADHAQAVLTGRGIRKEEHESRSGPDGPSLQGTPGTSSKN